jgi:hypothetical protein
MGTYPREVLVEKNTDNLLVIYNCQRVFYVKLLTVTGGDKKK